VDRLLRENVMKVDESYSGLPFGGKTILFGGDFR
jgi:hypothetical protein